MTTSPGKVKGLLSGACLTHILVQKQWLTYLILSIDLTNFSSAMMPLRAKMSKTKATNGKQAAKATWNVPPVWNSLSAQKA